MGINEQGKTNNGDASNKKQENASSGTYGLLSPAVVEESGRLSTQHIMWTRLAGGLYPPEADGVIQNALARAATEGRAPEILDVGCGSGDWSVEIAKKFKKQNAKVLGIDLGLAQQESVPDNCKFKQGDVVKELDNFSDHFDIIHCRSVAKHVLDAEDLTRKMAHALRPGGVFIFSDALTPIYDAKLNIVEIPSVEETYETSLDKSWFGLWLWKVTQTWQTKDKYDGHKLNELMKRTKEFEGIEQRVYPCPIGWDGDKIVLNEHGAEIGRLMAENRMSFISNTRQKLEDAEIPKSVLDTMQANVDREAKEGTKKVAMKWAINWATKKEVAP